MPGFLGGSTGGSSGTGGEISFPKEFIDPVTKLRVSQPENLIDTDFEYGLQPTKWETVELINNTPSFFSKSGDTTIPNIISITTNAGTREITVVCALEHGVSVGIPIQVTGTKSVTADGSYIINSIPNTTTFTYLCKSNQPTTSSIEDLYSSIITGEFFQGSQLRVADASGIVTNNAEGTSTLTVTTESAHGFKVNTPFYFLNLNSTISKDFQASNTAAKSFDSTNSAVAQTFDGSNTLSSINVDWSNSATIGGVISTISGASTLNNTLTVAHSTENFVGQPIGTPLYYSVTGGAGYFLTNPRGVIFLKSNTDLGSGSSTFQVSATPDGNVIPITAQPSGTFQLANQARTFSGNNLNSLTQTTLTVLKDTSFVFDGGNQGFAGAETNGLCTVEGYAGTILVSTTAGAGLDYYVGAMVRYTTTGTAASGLTNNRTYFINTFATTATPNQYRITIKELPDSPSALAPTGGTETQTFQKIGVAVDKDIVHVKNSNFAIKDMVEYTFPVSGRFTAGGAGEKLFYFVSKVYDAHNYELSEVADSFTVATGGVVSTVVARGRTYNVHTFTTVGSNNFVVSNAGSDSTVEYLLVAGGGGGATDGDVGGGGGGGGFLTGTVSVTAQTYAVVIGDGGTRGSGPDETGTGGGGNGGNGGNTTFAGLTAVGGGGGGTRGSAGAAGGSGGGGGDASMGGGAGTAGQGFAGGAGPGMNSNGGRDSGAGGGAGGAAISPSIAGPGRFSLIGRGIFAKGGIGSQAGAPRLAGAAGTGNGGDGTRAGGSGIAVLRYPTTAVAAIAPVASGGTISSAVVGDTTFRIHTFTTVGNSSFVVTNAGNLGPAEYMVIAGGGGGGALGGGGGAGGYLTGTVVLTAQTYPITVGNGGTGADASGIGENGGNSTAFGVTAIGGGGAGSHAGGYTSTGGRSGGSGGGGGDNGDAGGTGGAGTAGQGFAGAPGIPGIPGSQRIGGGGGGAGSPGMAGTSGGLGGDGQGNAILGTMYFWAAGGGAGGYTSSQGGRGGYGGGGGGTVNSGAGGAGGPGAWQGSGGNGVTGDSANGGTAAANSGSGGGGNSWSDPSNARTGAAGIVVVRYPLSITGII
jgi:hypothetical protein